MRPTGSTEALAARRLKAVRLVMEEGLTKTEAGARVGAHRNSVTLWVQMYERGGESALATHEPGVESRLTDAQRDDVICCILDGPKAHGFDTDLWTLPRVAKLIHRRHRVRYDVDHLSRLLRQWGLSWQKPALRPIERDEEAILRWLREEWPRIKKKRAACGRT